MTQKILFLFIFTFIASFSFGQCAIEPWSLAKRVDLSTLIVEGKVIDQYPFREFGKKDIYTASVIEVYKVFKGQVSSPYYIEIITFGGQIGLERHKASPELELQKDECGIFLLTKFTISSFSSCAISAPKIISLNTLGVFLKFIVRDSFV